MKGLKVTAIVAGITLAGAGAILATTNPTQSAYEKFATKQLIAYLEQNTCAKAPFGLERRCKSLLESNQSQIQTLIAQGTQRQNFIFFSLYTTDLSAEKVLPIGLGDLLPSYNFGTVGIFQNFHIYKAKKAKN
jgi:uncharacterized protein YceK